MRSRGFSLVEMIVAISILSILVTIATLRFQEYLQRYRSEAQTRLIYTELLKARTNAIYQRKGTRVRFFANRFEVYSSQQDGPLAGPVATYPLTTVVSSSFDTRIGGDIDFDEKGMTTDLTSICLQAGGSGGVDSIIIHFMRTSIGKKDKGESCEPDSITPQ